MRESMILYTVVFLVGLILGRLSNSWYGVVTASISFTLVMVLTALAHA